MAVGKIHHYKVIIIGAVVTVIVICGNFLWNTFPSAPPLKTPSNIPLTRLYENLIIDPLNKTLHFRNKDFFLGKVDAEDKSHLLLFLLGKHVDFKKFQRRVLLDLGAKTFQSSVQWFLTYYPGRFTEIHAFEMMKGVFKIPRHPALLKGAKCTLYEKKIDVVTTEQTIDIVDFMVNQLKLQPKDMVVLKMDIEGDEWKILKHMEKHNVFPLVDEMMVEVHYQHPRMKIFGWDKHNHTLDDADRLFKHLRQDLGVFVHPWP